MTTQPISVAGRRPVWRDPRFFGGLALIALSVLACTWLVLEARSGVAIYRATRALAPGETLNASNTTIVEVRIDSDLYLAEGQLGGGDIATRAIGEGELIPRSAVGPEGSLAQRRVVLTVADGLPENVEAGDRIELWFIPDTSLTQEQVEPAEAAILADDVTLVAVDDTSGVSSDKRIEVLVDSESLPQVLAATSARGALAAVPVGGP